MTFILRILFSGLIAFVPGSDGKELTVLLMSTPAKYVASDGSAVPYHLPLLLARAGSCRGTCPRGDANIVKYLFPETRPSAALEELGHAIENGGAWQLSGSDITLRAGPKMPLSAPPMTIVRKPGKLGPIPTSPEEREDFRWVANFNLIDPRGGGINPVFLSKKPGDLIAARLHLKNGKVSTYRLVAVGGNVEPIHFQPLTGDGKPSPYAQAIASWVEVEMEVSGDSLEIVDEKFGGGVKRTMRLTPPKDGVLEIAVLNQPALHPPNTPPSARRPKPGNHFELFYGLVKNPPQKNDRLVPHAPSATAPRAAQTQKNWDDLHPAKQMDSPLLRGIGLGAGRGPYDVLLCPMIGFGP